MSIHNFSKIEFITVVKNILKNETFFRFNDADTLKTDSSLREKLDISSLEIAELIIALEEKYHVDMEWAQTGLIDSIDDIYKAFNESIYRQRKAFITKQTLQNNALIK